MAKEPKKESKETGDFQTLSTPPSPHQLQIRVDDSQTSVAYSSTCQVRASAEDITLDFGGPLRPTGQNAAELKIAQRVILNPWAAKRLALALGQAVTRYEQTYGNLELDPRKRAVNPPPAPPTSGKLS